MASTLWAASPDGAGSDALATTSTAPVGSEVEARTSVTAQWAP
jgi:hypothetical protein